ncbi:MAG: murein hydrolase activator EnvC [bacterium]
MMSRLVMMILLVSLSMPLPLRAEEVESSIKTNRDKLEVIEEKITEAEKKIGRSTEKEVSILGNLELLDRDISSKRRNIRTLRTKETVLVKTIAQSEDDLALIREEKELVRRRLVNRAVALYKAGNVRYLKVILESSGVEDVQRRHYYMTSVMNYDTELFAKTADLYAREKEEVSRLRSDKEQLTSTRRKLEGDLTGLSRRRRKRDLLLAQVRNVKDRNTRLLQELEASSARLIQLIKALQRQASTGDSAFPLLKGGLKPPVSGKVIVDFGRNRNDRFNTYTLSRGITIQSAEGTPVRSVYRGKVLFADWFRGYGRIIILDHGGSYYTLYGHLSALHVEVGQEIEANEVIGLAGDSGSLEGPALYFEIRHQGKPVDPKPWLAGKFRSGG